jgi:hypothetical protein
MENPPMRPDVDISRPHMARIYDYFLGGQNHFAADRETAEKILEANPAIRIDEFARLAFAGLDLTPPGVVLVSEWRPAGDGPRPAPAEVNCYGGVARKP